MNILIVGNSNPKKMSGPICYTKRHIEEIKKIVPKTKISITDGPTDSLLKTADIIIHSHGYPVDFRKATNLKWVHSGSAGVQDLAADLKNTNIILTNSSGVHPIPISEHVAAYMLMFARKIYKTYRNQIIKKRWVRDFEDISGVELMGKTVGIVGYGRIGAEVAKISKGLGMKTSALKHKKNINDPMIDQQHESPDSLLKNSDFVVDCLPLTPETKGYFDLKKFKMMNGNTYFINIGRGGTVVEQDLADALKKNLIAGAGLDVFEVEPLPDSSPLWKLENVILTPHSSGWSPEYTNRVVNIFCENLRAYLKNKPMPNLVDKVLGY